MKFLVIVLVFFYIFPIFPAFLPLPLDRIIQVMALVYLGFHINKSRMILGNKIILGSFLLCFVLLFISILAQFRNLGRTELAIVKDSANLILYILSSTFIIFSAQRYWKRFSVTTILDILVMVGLLQAFVSMIFFFFPSIFEYYTGFLNVDANMGLMKRVGLIELRLIGVGNAFFNGVIKFGIIFLILTYLKYDKRSYFYNRPIIYFLSYSLILCAGLMTGRTFFIAVLLSIAYFVSKEVKRFIPFTFKVLGYSSAMIVFFIIFTSIFGNLINESRVENVKNFVFEIFINYDDTGEFRTSSSDKTADMYVFPDNISTWLIGDGRFNEEGGSYYMKTDVGYLRYIYYFGVIGTCFFFFVQYKVVNWIVSFNYSKDFSKLMYFLLFWILILNFKGVAYLDQFSALILAALILSNKKQL